MKKILISLTLVATSFSFANAQGGVAVNNSGVNPNANAMLDVDSDSKGILIPRITTIARTALGGAMGLGENGMLVYDKDLLVFYYWDGTQWVLVGNGTGTDDQNLTGATLTGTSLQIDIENGNSATVDLSSLQDGTGTDNQDLTLTGDILSLTNDGTTVDLSTIKDHDWYEVGGTTQADAITDDIFTNGNVGIGLTTPLSKLHISGTAPIILVEDNSTTDPIAAAAYTSFRTQGANEYGWVGDGSGSIDEIALFANGPTNNTRVGSLGGNVFLATGTGVGSERLTVIQNGNIGIGTTTPLYKLDVIENTGGANTVAARFETTTTAAGIAFKNTGTTSQPAIFSQSDDLSLWTSGNSRLWVTAGGNVGIGTGFSTPAMALHVVGGAGVITAERNGVDSWYWGINASRMNFTNNTTAIAPITLERTGLVGIANPNPTEALDVIGSAKIVDGTQGVGKVLTSDAAGKASWQFGGVPAGAIMAFDLATCPTGWAAADGTAGTPDLRGEFIRGLDNGRGIDVGRALNSWQKGSINVSDDGNGINAINTNAITESYDLLTLDQLTSLYPNTRDINGPASSGIGYYYNFPAPNYFGVTRPRNVALLYCKKQ